MSQSEGLFCFSSFIIDPILGYGPHSSVGWMRLVYSDVGALIVEPPLALALLCTGLALVGMPGTRTRKTEFVKHIGKSSISADTVQKYTQSQKHWHRDIHNRHHHHAVADVSDG